MTRPNRPNRPKKPSKEILNILRAYFDARAAAETLKPVVEKIQRDLLHYLGINYAPEYEQDGLKGPIENPDHSYLMSDEDAARYHPALDAAYRAAGFNLPENYCPYLVAKAEQTTAENLLLDASAKWFKFPELCARNLHGDMRDRAIELHLKFFTQFL